jgi:hypothetical protein
MNVWLRRLLMLLAVLVWLAIMLIPALAFILARNEQIQIGRGDGRHWRVFLLHDADSEGLGLERSRPVAPPGDAPSGVSCLRTTVDYWLWVGEIPGVSFGAAYCQCFDAATGDALAVMPPACLSP